MTETNVSKAEALKAGSHFLRGTVPELGVSEPRISQLHSRAMRRLKTLMAEAQTA